MLMFSLLTWWYTAGWAQLAQRTVVRIAGVLDFFSVGLLLKSLFAPFRQISVGRVQGSLDAQLRAWGDLQISRLIGAGVRLMVILFGLLSLAVMSIVSLVLLLIWPLVPLVPCIALVVALGLR